MKNKLFTLNSTNSCKGIALILLLWHHLFYEHRGFTFTIYKTASLAKVCVAIFILLSGYGLAESVDLNSISFVINMYCSITND